MRYEPIVLEILKPKKGGPELLQIAFPISDVTLRSLLDSGAEVTNYGHFDFILSKVNDIYYINEFAKGYEQCTNKEMISYLDDVMQFKGWGIFDALEQINKFKVHKHEGLLDFAVHCIENDIFPLGSIKSYEGFTDHDVHELFEKSGRFYVGWQGAVIEELV